MNECNVALLGVTEREVRAVTENGQQRFCMTHFLLNCLLLKKKNGHNEM